MAKKKAKKRNAHRRNQGIDVADAGLPIGRFVEVEAIKVNRDGSIDVLVPDSELTHMPEAAALVAENRRRRNARRR